MGAARVLESAVHNAEGGERLMRIWTEFHKVFAPIAVAITVWGCSSPNSNTPVLDSSGKHVADWIVGHRASYVGNPKGCVGCHGSDLLGGISRVSCFSSDFNGQACHASGPVGHPAGWRDPSLHGATAKSQ